ncbi:MAG: LysM peptidoglycan-binding domain-containing protein [Cyanobacteria bacterium J06629_18]
MTIKLNCPVCGYTEVEGNNCPNCDTDLTLIRMLQQLPAVENSPSKPDSRWQLLVAIMILLIGMGLGVFSSFLFMQPQIINAEVTTTKPVIVATPSPELTSIAPKIAFELSEPVTYTAKAGDNLSQIAEKFCGQGTSWQIMVKANPQLKNREDDIDVGEVFQIPKCKENDG